MAKGRASSIEALMPARRRGGRPAPNPTATQSRERGRQARAEVPLAEQATFIPLGVRPDPVSLLERQGADRIPELLPIRYGRMASSPFAFFRGGAGLMAADLAATPAAVFADQPDDGADPKLAKGAANRAARPEGPTRAWFPETFLFEPLVVTDDQGAAVSCPS